MTHAPNATRGSGTTLQTLLRPARAVCNALLDTLLPQTCVACNTWIAGDGPPVCPTCRAALEAVAALPHCPRCARTMSPLSIHDKGCARCRTEHFWNVAGIARVGEYREESLRNMLVGLKFSGNERQASFLGNLLANTLRKTTWFRDIDAFVPVPMHRLRRCQRPCDHARMLAETVGCQLRVPVLGADVRRVRYAISQTRTPSQAQRFKNVRDCFVTRNVPRIAGKTVSIIDNLLVTGATIHEVSTVLRKAGAKRIYAAVIARSTLPGDPQPKPPPTDSDQSSAVVTA